MKQSEQRLREAVFLLKQAQHEIQSRENAAHEPIAVVGIGCRLPGGSSTPEAYWQMLTTGTDAITEIPADRWNVDEYYDSDPLSPNRMTMRCGGFVDDVQGFDAEFFGISPREASRMDPQHRLTLEVTWEALERSGIVPGDLAGTKTGVFVGFVQCEYQSRLRKSNQEIDMFSAAGCATSILANRISYVLNLLGPSVALDTACSSSLVTVHMACQSLRRGESDIALAGGVNLIASPETSVVLSKAQMLSPNGRCRTFDALADGYVRGEGCGMIVLKRLSDALANEDPILATIRGTAVNHGGRGNGLSAPNGLQQEAVIRAALEDARLSPHDIDYLEAHGTGTKLGDPIEFGALMSIFAENRESHRPLILGSVKTNIGHLESAAGIAGLIKAILALQHESIPPHLHLENPNPLLELDSSPIVIPTESMKWERNGHPRRAGVSSFGFGGTNAHVVVEESPSKPSPKILSTNPQPQLVVLSGKTPAARTELVRQLSQTLTKDATLDIEDVAFTTNCRRSHLTHRVAVVAESSEQLRKGLESFVDHGTGTGVFDAECGVGERPSVAFLFTGQGSQYAGMASELYACGSVFHDALDTCAAIADPLLDYPLLQMLDENSGDAINQTSFTQPALFAMEYALAKQWEAYGITPDVVMGHSVGEFAAAVIAGLMTLEDGMRLIITRGKLMQQLPAGGLMATVFCHEQFALDEIAKSQRDVSVAAINGPDNTVISGGEVDVRAILDSLNAHGVRSVVLQTSHAFHSSQMTPITEALDAAAAEIQYRELKIPFISNVSGQIADEGVFADPNYWSRHARNPVRFSDGIATLAKLECDAILEIGPHATLVSMAQRCADAPDSRWLSSLRRGQSDRTMLLRSLAQLYLCGATINWRAVVGHSTRRHLDLPTYPFQRKRYWIDAECEHASGAGVAASAPENACHPLLGRRIVAPIAERIHEKIINEACPKLLSDHCVQNRAVMPGSAYIEMAIAAANEIDGKSWLAKDVSILQPLVLSPENTCLQTILSPERPGLFSFRIVSQTDNNGRQAFVTHASGILESERATAEDFVFQLDELKGKLAQHPLSMEWVDEQADRVGLQYGPAFTWKQRMWFEGTTALCELREPQEKDGIEDFHVHPGVIDAMFQVLGTTLADRAKDIAHAYVPATVESMRLIQPPAGRLWIVADQTALNENAAIGDIRLVNDAGQIFVECKGVTLQRVPSDWLKRIVAGPAPKWLHEMAWIERPSLAFDELHSISADKSTSRSVSGGNDPNSARATVPQRWLIVSDTPGVGASLEELLERRDHEAIVIPPGLQQNELVTAVAGASSDTSRPIDGVVYLAGFDSDAFELPEPQDNSTPYFEIARQRGWGGMLDVIQQFTSPGQLHPPQLFMATRGSQAVGRELRPISLGQSPMWGLGRVVAAEHPELRCVRIDLDPANSNLSNVADELFTELFSNDHEDQVAYRGGTRFVQRLRSIERNERLTVPPNEPYRLEIQSRGSLDGLTIRPAQRTKLEADQVEIRVTATGLNFRDVLNVLDLYPGDPGPLGGECAGEVTAVGSEVRNVKPGDRVTALAPASFSTYAVTLSDFVVPIPNGLTEAEAAGLPIAFATVHYALRKLGQIRQGSRVLIHSATGGVGLAAIQIARHAGAEVFATAGNERKRQYLRELGIEHVLDSRSLDFADEVMRITHGRGVDMVLNTLTGEAIEKGISILAENGHFLELGKTDLWTQERVTQFHPTARFHAIALDHMMADEPDTVGILLHEVMDEFCQSVLNPLPVRSYQVGDAVAAFRHMQRAEHIGKVILTAGVTSDDSSEFTLRKDRSYLVTGGLGGLGLKVAHWLATRGAGCIVLTGRSKPNADVRRQLDELQCGATRVETRQCDVSNFEDTQSLFEEFRSELPELAGVIHLAGVLDDRVLRDQNRERFDRVFAPKVHGGWNLHELTRERELDFFVLFSSAASLLGSPGQGNYAAANSFLDSLAHERRRLGLPGLSVNWGNWSDVGMAARLKNAEGARWAQMGVGWIDPDRGLETLERLISENRTQAGVLPFEWPKFLAQLPPGSDLPWLSEIAGTVRRSTQESGSPELLERLMDVPANEQFETVLTFAQQLAGRVLAMDDASQLDLGQPLNELGFDSLTAVEFCNAFGRAADQHINPMVLFDYPTLESLSTHVARDLLRIELPSGETKLVDSEEMASDESSDRENILEDVESMTSDEIEELINGQLSNIRDSAA